MKTNDADISEESQREFAARVLKHAAQRDLAAGVLKQAAQDLRRYHGATSKIERELYLDAYRWLTVDECSSPFSFLNICELLNLAPENVRHELVGDDSEVGERTIDVQINRLRRKIERDPSNPVWLQTVRGIGYRLSVE